MLHHNQCQTAPAKQQREPHTILLSTARPHPICNVTSILCYDRVTYCTDVYHEKKNGWNKGRSVNRWVQINIVLCTVDLLVDLFTSLNLYIAAVLTGIVKWHYSIWSSWTSECLFYKNYKNGEQEEQSGILTMMLCNGKNTPICPNRRDTLFQTDQKKTSLRVF